MGIFADTAQKFEKAASLVPSMVDKTIVVTEEQLLDLNRSQLIDGKKSDGQSIKPKYTKPYAKIKKKIGSKSSPTPDLKVKGTFYNSFDTKIKARTIEIKGTLMNKGFDVAAHLEKRYSENIYGLTDKNIGIYSQRIFLPVFTKQLRNELQ